MVGTASALNSARRLIRGNLASAVRPGAAAPGAIVQPGGEDLSQVAEVSVAFPGGDLGQPGGLGPDGGRLEFTGRGADGGLGGGAGDGGHGALLESSWS
jgi:hypothetical protein